MLNNLRKVLAVLVMCTVSFFAVALFLAKPSGREPRFVKRLRFNMWAEFMAMIGYGLWHPRLLFSGSSRAEKNMVLPGDALVPHANTIITHGITINSSPQKIWPWLLQMGAGRAFWYSWSPAHVFPEYKHHISPDYIEPTWQNRQVGDVVLDGDALNQCNENKGAWRIKELQDARAIVFYSARDMIEGNEFDPDKTRPRMPYAITSWTFCINPIDERQSRLLIRERVELGPSLLVPPSRCFFGTADTVFEQTILHGIKYRAERCGDNRLPAASA